MNPKAETVVNFCVKTLLDIFEEVEDRHKVKRLRHKDPYEAVVKALQKKYHIDRDSAYETFRRQYWHLMETKVIDYRGVEWLLNGKDKDVSSIVGGVIAAHGEYIDEVIADWHKI
jgi:hypothetical protein